MDPRHSPEYKRAKRQAVRDARDEQRAARGRGANGPLLSLIEGALCAEVLRGETRDEYVSLEEPGLYAPPPDLSVLFVLKDYLNKGLLVSPKMERLIRTFVDTGYLEPGEGRELVLEMLKGAVGLLSAGSKGYAYYLLEEEDSFLSFSAEKAKWEGVKDILNQALRREFYAKC